MRRLILCLLLFWFFSDSPSQSISYTENESMFIAVFQSAVKDMRMRFSKKTLFLLGLGSGLDSSPVSNSMLEVLSDLDENIKAYPGSPQYLALGCSENIPCQLLCVSDLTKVNDSFVYVICARWQLPQRNNADFYRYTLEYREGIWVVTEKKLVGVS